MSELQRDIERMERLVEAVGDEYDEAAVQRIRARLTPDRERAARVIREAEEALLKSVRAMEDDYKAWYALEEAMYALLSELKKEEGNDDA